MAENFDDFVEFTREEYMRASAEDCDNLYGPDDDNWDDEDDDDEWFNDEPEDCFRDDIEADADVLRSAGWGTNEDYGYYGDYDDYF